MQVEGVLCDLDGTLVDSEQYHLEAWNLLLERNGHKPEPRWNVDCIGLPDTYARDKAIRLFPDMARYGNLLDMKQEVFRESIAGKGPGFAYPGVREKLIELAGAGIKLAVGTNSIMLNTQTELRAAGFQDFFPVIVTLDMVRNGKPDGEIYRTAAELLGLDPSVCIVLEDSPAGVASGKAAGCRVAGVTNTWGRGELPGADWYFSDTPSAMDFALKGRVEHVGSRG